jgi:hypothetical protein
MIVIMAGVFAFLVFITDFVGLLITVALIWWYVVESKKRGGFDPRPPWTRK